MDKKIRKGRARLRQDKSRIDDLVRARIDQLIRESESDDYASVSELLGRNHAYIHQYVRRGTPRRLREEDRRLIARHFEIPPQTLFVDTDNTGEINGQPHHCPANERANYADPDGDLVVLPLCSGDSARPDPAERPPRIGFSPDFLEQLTRKLECSGLVALSVPNDSMAPTMKGGDIMLVATGLRAPPGDGIYALRINGRVVPRRLSLLPDGENVILSSDNRLYGAHVTRALSALDILGRIVWCGLSL